MSFVYPYLALLMGIPFVVMAALILTNKDRLERIFDKALLERLSANSHSLPPKVRSLVLFMAIFLLLIALARPVKELGESKVQLKGLSVLVALDISVSMRSKDVYPNRLAFAKTKIETLFEAMPHDRLGLVAFSQSAFMVSPFSSNKATLTQMISGIDSSYINTGATNFVAIASLASEILQDKEPKLLVLFSDGGDAKALEGFSDALQAEGIALYSVLVGSKEGAPVLDEEDKPLSLTDGTIAITQRDDTLLEVSQKNSGMGVVAGTGKQDIETLVATMRQNNSNEAFGEVAIKERKEYFYYPLALGTFFLLLGFSSLPSRSRV